MRKRLSGFTPLEKAADFNPVSRVRKKLSNGIRERSSLTGFTLMELMIAAAVLSITLLGLLGIFTACLWINETARNMTMAINGAQQKLEEMRNHDFAQIPADYASGGSVGNIFDPCGEDDNLNNVLDFGEDDNGNGQLDSPFNGGAAVIITPLVPGDFDLLQIRVITTWMQRGARQYGEDDNLNGTLDFGEDDNLNGQLDSPVETITLMAQR